MGLPGARAFCLSEFWGSDRAEAALPEAIMRHSAGNTDQAICRREITPHLIACPPNRGSVLACGRLASIRRGTLRLLRFRARRPPLEACAEALPYCARCYSRGLRRRRAFRLDRR